MNAKLEFTDAGFKKMIQELSAMSGRTFDHVIQLEAARILKRIISKSPASGVTQSRKIPLKQKAEMVRSGSNRSFKFATGEIIFTHPAWDRRIMLDYSNWNDFSQRKSAKRPFIRRGRSMHDMSGGRKWSDQRWQRYRELEHQIAVKNAEAAKRIPKTKGVARQSWLQSARDLNLDMEIIKPSSFVRKAVQLSRTQFTNSKGTKIETKTNFALEFQNSYPQFQNGGYSSAVINGAIKGRIKAFNIDMEKGVFEDVKRRAKRYKGVFITTE
jgi:hypothetical protein